MKVTQYYNYGDMAKKMIQAYTSMDVGFDSKKFYRVCITLTDNSQKMNFSCYDEESNNWYPVLNERYYFHMENVELDDFWEVFEYEI